MSLQKKSKQLEITIPDQLYEWVVSEAQHRTLDISAIIQIALEHYIEQFDMTQTETWQLRGTFTIAEPEMKYVVDSDETDSPITNYAEQVDDVLYKGE